MPVYYFTLVWTIIWGIVSNCTSKRIKISDKIYENRTKLVVAIIIILPVIILAGARTSVADTQVYIQSFEILPKNLKDAYILLKGQNERDPGFLILSVFIRQYISTDYTIWLSIIAVISGISVMIPLYKYSCNYGISMFLFITSCQFTWMFNGMRQFIAASILFGCTGLVLNRRFVLYTIVVCLLSTIHESALILIPVYFIVTGEPCNPSRRSFFSLLFILEYYFSYIIYKKIYWDIE